MSKTEEMLEIYGDVREQEGRQEGELRGKVLTIEAWFASNREADRLAFKDVFRHAAKHGLIPADACERWLEYRDNRNDTAHDYGRGFAEATLKLLPRFVDDARELAAVVEGKDDG